MPLVGALRGMPAPAPPHVLERDFPIERQKRFDDVGGRALGFDLEAGGSTSASIRSASMIGPGDVRVALRYDPRDFTQGFYALLHELGHAFYDQGLDTDHYGTPLGEAASLGVHESQSRMWENHVGRSHGFWAHFYPQLRGTFPEALHDVSLDAFRRAVNHVAPGVSGSTPTR